VGVGPPAVTSTEVVAVLLIAGAMVAGIKLLHADRRITTRKITGFNPIGSFING
jgi:hypothetical protein